MNKNNNKKYSNLWDTIKTILRSKFTALSMLKMEKSHINNLMTHLKTPEKQEDTIPLKGQLEENIMATMAGTG